jgi:trimethylamine--corrinoid protein Co-methyltransferase
MQAPPTVPFGRLSDAQCSRVYAACLQVLERTGVLMVEPEAVAILRKAGAQVEGNRVRIPARLVEWARSTAPKQVTLFNRQGQPAMPVAGRVSFFGPGSDCLHIIDHRTGQRREAVLQDVVEGMIVADALPNIDFVMCMFLPHDVDQVAADRYQMAAMLQHTSKPIVYVTTEFGGCLDAVAMAEAVVGGAEALRERPQAACYINVTTGLVHNQEALQKLLYLAKKGLPFTYVPSAQGGMTAPVTLAGGLAVKMAGVMAGLALSQLVREGTPFIMPGWSAGALDMRTTVLPYADPDKRLLGPDFGHWFGLPMFALAGCSDSKAVDQQAAIEAALTLMTDALAGAHIVHDLGYLESGLTGSLAQLVICDEILNWLGHLLRPVEVNDETLALDLIDAVGPEGHFLETDHTFAHFRDRWYPDLIERDNYENWWAAGGRTLAERAAERVENILAEHRPPSLPPTVLTQLQGIIAAARLNHE